MNQVNALPICNLKANCKEEGLLVALYKLLNEFEALANERGLQDSKVETFKSLGAILNPLPNLHYMQVGNNIKINYDDEVSLTEMILRLKIWIVELRAIILEKGKPLDFQNAANRNYK